MVNKQWGGMNGNLKCHNPFENEQPGGTLQSVLAFFSFFLFTTGTQECQREGDGVLLQRALINLRD